MTSRIRMFSTLLLLCHAALWPMLVTSQIQSGTTSTVDGRRTTEKQASGKTRNEEKNQKLHLAGPTEEGEEVTIEARQQEKQGDVFRLKGDVVITFRQFVVRADEITYNSASGEITATGHLSFDGGPFDEHLEASHGTLNVKTQVGRFYDVKGTTGAHFRGSHVVLTSSNPFFFSGSMVEKYGTKYVVHHGVVTSCELPKPKWSFNAEKVTVVPGDEARMYHANFRLFGVPIFYFPYAQHPVDRLGRQSGFLIPTIGQSSRKGTILGESVYWAINRSMDATIGAEYFSHRGWSQHGEFRARPSQDSYLDATYFGVLDRGFGTPRVDQGGEDIRVNGEAKLPLGFRGVADLDYLSSFVFRLAFADTFSLAVNSEVRSNAFGSRSDDGYMFNIAASRYQNFQSPMRGDVITILHAPSIDLGSVERQLGKTPVYWSYNASAGGVSRREPGFVTDAVVGRFDVHPTVALPLHLGGWDFRPEIGMRDTYYTQRTNGSVTGLGSILEEAINRRALETGVEIRPPALSRIFSKKIADHTIKHTIEPRIRYRFVNGVENFPEIIRFDVNDIVSDTNELEYALVNRVYAKGSKSSECRNEIAPATAAKKAVVPGTPGVAEENETREEPCRPGPPQAREVFSWEVAQKYYFDPTFGNALVAGRRNVFTSTVDFTGIAFLTEPRKFSPILSRMRVNPSSNTDLSWSLDYDTLKGRINDSTVLLDHHFGNFFVGGSHAFLHVPGEVFSTNQFIAPAEFNQFRWLVGYGNPNKRGMNAAVNVGYDIEVGALQYTAVQSSYNWDCCGISVEYRRFALGSVRNENQFRFALSLTNVGTFGTMRRQERLF
jgi:LPS-assembly protein